MLSHNSLITLSQADELDRVKEIFTKSFDNEWNSILELPSMDRVLKLLKLAEDKKFIYPELTAFIASSMFYEMPNIEKEDSHSYALKFLIKHAIKFTDSRINYITLKNINIDFQKPNYENERVIIIIGTLKIAHAELLFDDNNYHNNAKPSKIIKFEELISTHNDAIFIDPVDEYFSQGDEFKEKYKKYTNHYIIKIKSFCFNKDHQDVAKRILSQVEKLVGQTTKEKLTETTLAQITTLHKQNVRQKSLQFGSRLWFNDELRTLLNEGYLSIVHKQLQSYLNPPLQQKYTIVAVSGSGLILNPTPLVNNISIFYLATNAPKFVIDYIDKHFNYENFIIYEHRSVEIELKIALPSKKIFVPSQKKFLETHLRIYEPDWIGKSNYDGIMLSFEKILLGLRYLDLSDISLKNDFHHLISLYKKNIPSTKLIALNLSNTDLIRDDILILIEFLKKYSKLMELHLSRNNIGGYYTNRNIWGLFPTQSAIEILARELNGNEHLKRLSLDQTGLNNFDAIALTEMLDSLESMVDLTTEINPQIESKTHEDLTHSIKSARGRAEILGYNIPEASQQFLPRMNSLTANQLNIPEDEKSEHIENKLETYNWVELRNLGLNMLQVFIPSKNRETLIQNKYKKMKNLLNRYEASQFRAKVAMNKILKLPESFPSKVEEQSEAYLNLQEIWLEFMLDAELETYLISQANISDQHDNVEATNNIPFIIMNIRDFYQICKSAYETHQIITGVKFDKKSVPESSDFTWPEKFNYPQFHWFNAHFYWYIEELYNSSTIHKGFVISKYKNGREQLIRLLSQTTFNTLIGLPAAVELAHRFYEYLVTAESFFHLSTLPELAHAYELIHSGGHLLEESLEYIHHLVHNLSSIPKRALEIYNKKYVSTADRFDNVKSSFANDYKYKIEGVMSTFAAVFEPQLKMLTNQSAGLFAQVCMKHLAEPLMLGIFKGSGLGNPVLTTREFISLAFEYLLYIPIKSPPLLELNSGGFISAQVLLRAAIRCYINNKEETFYWTPFEGKILEKYRSHFSYSTFKYECDHRRAGSRWATENELEEHIKPQLQSDSYNPEAVILGKKQNKSLAQVSLVIDKNVMSAFHKLNILSVKTNSFTYRADVLRIMVLEEKEAQREMREKAQLEKDKKIQSELEELRNDVNKLKSELQESKTAYRK